MTDALTMLRERVGMKDKLAREMTHEPYVDPFGGVAENFALGVYESPGLMMEGFDFLKDYTSPLGIAVDTLWPTETTSADVVNELMGMAAVEQAFTELGPYDASGALQALSRFGGQMIDPLAVGGAGLDAARMAGRYGPEALNILGEMAGPATAMRGQGALDRAYGMKAEQMFDPAGIDYDDIYRQTGVDLGNLGTFKNETGALGDTPANMIQSPNEVRPHQSTTQDVYEQIRGHITQALDRSRGDAISGNRGPQSGPWEAKSFDAGSNAELGGDLSKFVDRQYALRDEYSSGLASAGQATQPYYELKPTRPGARKFRELISSSKDKLGAKGAAVDVYDDYSGMRLFVSGSGESGFAVKPDGDVISVFSTGADPKGMGPQMTLLATQEGGRKLDAFDTFLPSMYNKAGYEGVGSARFDPEFAPSDWDVDALGSPNIAAMTFKPEGQLRPYDRNNPFINPDMWEDQTKSIWTPELTPGVTRRLPEIIERSPKPGTRTTVREPLRKMYPGIYQDPRKIIEQAATKIAPENPAMKDIFGVTRQDLDDLTRQLQVGHENIDIPVWQTSERGAPHTGKIMTGANAQRLQDILTLASADPRFAGNYGWYYTAPLLDRYIEIHGPERGLKLFDDFMQKSSALSSGSPVTQEIKRASVASNLHRRGELGSFIDKSAVPPGYGHIYHSTAHADQLRRFDETGRFYDEESMLGAPKTPNYYFSKTGENLDWPTPDAHFVRGTGLADVRPTPDAGSIKKTEAKPVREWFVADVAEPLGMKGSPSQAVMWNVLAPQTDVKTDVGKPFLELFVDAAEREAAKTGGTAAQAIDEFIRGNGKLAGFAPVAPVFGDKFLGEYLGEKE